MSYIIRFISGALIGLGIFAIRWILPGFDEYQLTLTQGIIGCSVLSIVCGLITVKWGYGILWTSLSNLNL
jgi:hypothetical protein